MIAELLWWQLQMMLYFIAVVFGQTVVRRHSANNWFVARLAKYIWLDLFRVFFFFCISLCLIQYFSIHSAIHVFIWNFLAVIYYHFLGWSSGQNSDFISSVILSIHFLIRGLSSFSYCSPCVGWFQVHIIRRNELINNLKCCKSWWELVFRWRRITTTR